MNNLEVFTKSALLLKRNVLEPRSDYQIFRQGMDVQLALQVKEDKMVFLNGEWLYKPCDDEGKSIEEDFFNEYFIGHDYIPVNLPKPRGSGAYIKRISITKEQSLMETFIRFTGVNASFYLWVNGNFAAYNKEAKGVSEIRLTQYLEAGVNTVAMLVLNEQEHCNGIWGDIDLLFRPQEHITDIEVTIEVDKYRENAVMELELFYDNNSVIAEYILVDPNGKKIMKDSFVCGKAICALPEPMLWSAETPNVYTMMIMTSDEMIVKEIPIYQSEFFDDGNLLINGTEVQLSGTQCSDVEEWRSHTLTKPGLLLQLMRMKQHNINALELIGVECSEWFQMQCIKFGIYLILTDGISTEEFIDWNDQEHLQEFKDSHIPIRTVVKDVKNLFISITNNYDFKNIVDDVYVKMDLFKGGVLICCKKIHLLDLNPKETETLKITDQQLETGRYSVHICYRQFVGTMAIKNNFKLGSQILYLDI